MLEKQKRTNIIKDTQYTFPIHGKIVKFTAFAKRVPERTKIKVRTAEGEIVWEGIIKEHLTTVHPINVIRDNVIVEMDPITTIININGEEFEQIVQPEPVVRKEVVYSDYYYSLGSVQVTISGLNEGESVDEIRIMTDKNQEHD